MWIPVLLLAVWTIAPALTSLSISFKDPVAVYTSPGLIPTDPSLESYRRVLARPGFQSALVNSIVIGIGTCILTLVLAVPAAYAFARYRFRGRHLLLLLILLPKLLPSLGLMVPLYRLAVTLGVLNSRLTLIIVYTGIMLPLAVWLLAGFFQQIPRDLEEAASVDGATLWERLRLVVLPLSYPALIMIGVVALREAWNEFTLVLVLTSTPDSRTLPYELFRLQGAAEQQDLSVEAAFALLTIVPLLFFYSWLERYLVQGITAGAVK